MMSKKHERGTLKIQRMLLPLRFFIIANILFYFHVLGLTIVAHAYTSSGGDSLPGVHFSQAPLISPNAAADFYGASQTHTNRLCQLLPDSVFCDDPVPLELKELAKSLGAHRFSDADFATNVFDYVYLNIDTEFRYGLGKGAFGAMLDQSGTPFDQAQLLVTLLEEGGIASTYEVGTVTLTADQFGKWSGLVSGLEEDKQAFSVNAKAVCHFLADGGIPAIINGSSDSNCQISGSLSTVTLGHIWVAALGKKYDPSIRFDTLKSGIPDLAAVMGCGSGCGDEMVAAAFHQATHQTDSIGEYAQNINEQALDAKLNDLAIRLQNYLQDTLPDGELEDVIGGQVVDLSNVPSAGSDLPYPAMRDHSWQGDRFGLCRASVSQCGIPDQYRTKFGVRFDGANLMDTRKATPSLNDDALFADEINGSWLHLGGAKESTSFPTQREIVLLLESHSRGKRPSGVSILATDLSTIVNDDMVLHMRVDHPYGAENGHYADAEVTKNFVMGECRSDFLDRIPSGCSNAVAPATLIFDLGHVGAAKGARQARYGLRFRQLPITSFFPRRLSHEEATLGSYWIAGNPDFASNLLPLNWMEQQSAARNLAKNLSDTQDQHHHSVGVIPLYGPLQFLDIETRLSATSATVSTVDRQSFLSTSAGLLSALEGHVSEEANGTWISGDTSSLFLMANRNQQKFYNINSGNKGKFQNSRRNYEEFEQRAIDQYLNNMAPNYSVIAPLDGNPGEFSDVYSSTLHLVLAGFIAFPEDQSSASYMVTTGVKGSGDIQVPVSPDETIVKVLEQVSDPISASASVDPLSGAMTLNFPPDIVTGQGDFPYSLPFQRSYNPEDNSLSIIGTELQIQGHNHNYNIAGKFSTDFAAWSGVTEPIFAAEAIAAISGLLHTNTQSGFRNRLTSVLLLSALKKTLHNNVFQVQMGPQNFTFARKADAKYQVLGGGPQALILSEAPLNPIWIFGPAYFYQDVQLQFFPGDGSRIDLLSPTAILGTESVPSLSFATAFPTTFLGNRFRARTWTFPFGVELTFDYDRISSGGEVSSPVTGAFIPPNETYWLKSVENNLGRRLQFYEDREAGLGQLPYTIGDIVIDDTGRRVEYTHDQVIFPDGRRLSYHFERDENAPELPFLLQYQPHFHGAGTLTLQYGDDPSQTDTILFNDLGRVVKVENALGEATTYYPGKMATERYGRAEVVDALGNSNVSYHNEDGAPIIQIDPIGRRTVNAYDSKGRLVSTIFPEQNRSDYTYDARGNILTERISPKPGSNLPVIRIETAYAEGADRFSCVNPITCNKPIRRTDARNNVIDYVWNSQTGTLTSFTEPETGTGRPQTEFFYNSLGQVTEITNPEDEKSCFTYDASNKHVLATATISCQSGGLNLQTIYTTDTIGNVTAIDGARSDVLDKVHYHYDEQRRVIWAIQPDPDGAGQIRHSATHTLYDDRGQVREVKRGSPGSDPGEVFSDPPD